MHEILQTLAATLQQGQVVIFCGIVESSGSAPRTSGARMLVLPDGTSTGSVGGGPVEGATLAKAKEMLAGNKDQALLAFDLSNSTAAEAGMVCGGAVRVLLQRVTPGDTDFWAEVLALFRNRKRPALTTAMESDGQARLGVWSPDTGLRGVELPLDITTQLARKAAKTRQPFRLVHEETQVFVEPLLPPTTLYLVGAGHVALATAKVAALAGFELVVMDDRREFANQTRYPQAREVRALENFENCLFGLGPDDYIVIVTRGHVHDRDVLAQALRTKAGYIGMIGSKPKRAAVYQSLLESGFTQKELDQVHSPIGLPIGADTPGEIAVSIVAELIKVRAGLT